MLTNSQSFHGEYLCEERDTKSDKVDDQEHAQKEEGVNGEMFSTPLL